MPTYEIVIKQGALYMLLRTMNPALGLSDGTRFTLQRATPRVLQTQVTDPRTGSFAFVPQILLASNEDERTFVLK